MKLRWGIVALLVLGAGLFGALTHSTNWEPVSEGRSLHLWLADLDVDGDTYVGGPATPRSRAESAIRALGTNAIPWLLSEMRARDSTWRKYWIHRRPRLPFPRLQPDHIRRWQASAGVQVLGPAAASALPNLIALLDSADTAYTAVPALAAVGSQTVPLLVEALQSTNPTAVVWAATALGHFSDRARIAVEPLLTVLDQGLPEARAQAAFALGSIHLDTDRVVPALSVALDNPDHFVRLCAANALGVFARSASNAIPSLLRAQAEADPVDRGAIADALRKVKGQ